jgi:hypothetical protein
MKIIFGFAIPSRVIPGGYIALTVCECGQFLQKHESSNLEYSMADIQHPEYRKFYRRHANGNFRFKWIAYPKQHRQLRPILANSKDSFLRDAIYSLNFV